jgi:hypothetical protein
VPNAGTNSYTIYIRKGTYEINQLNEYLQNEMEKQTGSLYKVDGVTITANESSLKAVLTFGKPTATTKYWVDFNVNNSIAIAPRIRQKRIHLRRKKRRSRPIPVKSQASSTLTSSENIARIEEYSGDPSHQRHYRLVLFRRKSNKRHLLLLPNRLNLAHKIVEKPFHHLPSHRCQQNFKNGNANR